jgi:NADH dehydrogenase FAD-containing subunit
VCIYCCLFIEQDIPDARKIRNRIIKNIELSLHPGLDDNERKRLLNFVIVGGGPTGVEFGAELYDWIEQVNKWEGGVWSRTLRLDRAGK